LETIERSVLMEVVLAIKSFVRFSTAVSLFGMSAIAASPVAAETLLDTVGAGGFSNSGGYFIQDQGSIRMEAVGIEFSTSTAVTITEINAGLVLSLANGTPINTNATFGILANAPSTDLPTGPLLDSASVPVTGTSAMKSLTTSVSLSPENWSIGPGSYWFVIESQPGTNLQWNSTSGDTPTARLAFGSWSAQDPSVVGQVQIFGEPTIAAVPEPSTWAMMIVGFAGVGLMAFRRKTAAISQLMTA
jgi:PEP-CTERM motif